MKLLSEYETLMYIVNTFCIYLLSALMKNVSDDQLYF